MTTSLWPNTALQRTAFCGLISTVLNYCVALAAVTPGVEAAAELGR